MNFISTILMVISFTILSGCASLCITKDSENLYPPIEASLTNINQKVAGNLLLTEIPEGFNEIQYKKAVEEVCFPEPTCRTKAEKIFDAFELKVKKVDDMFSVMLCDKKNHWKIMEDYSCNNRLVEIHTWKMVNKIPCEFETDWAEFVKTYCNY